MSGEMKRRSCEETAFMWHFWRVHSAIFRVLCKLLTHFEESIAGASIWKECFLFVQNTRKFPPYLANRFTIDHIQYLANGAPSSFCTYFAICYIYSRICSSVCL